MKADQSRVKSLLTETIIMLCKNGLKFDEKLVIQGVIGVTIDRKDVFLVHVNDRQIVSGIKSEPGQISSCTGNEIGSSTTYSDQSFPTSVKSEYVSKFKQEAYRHDEAPQQSLQHESAGDSNMFTGVNMMDSVDEGEATDEYSNQEMETAINSFSDAAHAPSFVKSEPSYQQEDVKPTFNSANWALAIPGSGSNSQFSSPALSSSSSSLPRFPQFTQSIHRGQNMSSPSRRVRGVRRGPMSMMGLQRTPPPVSPASFNPQSSPLSRMPYSGLSPNNAMCQPYSSPPSRSRRPRGVMPGMSRGMAMQSRGSPTVPSPHGMRGQASVRVRNMDGYSYGKQTVTNYICNMCEAVYKNHSSLLTHQVKVHGRQKKVGVGRRPKNQEGNYGSVGEGEVDEGGEDEGDYDDDDS